MKFTQLILPALAFVLGSSLINSCKSKTVEPDVVPKNDTTSISISHIPKKLTFYGQDSGLVDCSTCREEKVPTFDANGNLTKVVNTFYNDNNITKKTEIVFEWEKDKLIKTIDKEILPGNKQYSTIYKYNELGKIIEMHEDHRRKYPEKNTIKYSYSNDGKLVTILRNNDDSTSVVEKNDTTFHFSFRRHVSGDNSWIPSADYVFIKKGKVFTIHEIGYSSTIDKVITKSTEATSIITFSDKPASKQMQMLLFSPMDGDGIWPSDYYPSKSYTTDKTNGVTTESECDCGFTVDSYQRVTEWDNRCDGIKHKIEY